MAKNSGHKAQAKAHSAASRPHGHLVPTPSAFGQPYRAPHYNAFHVGPVATTAAAAPPAGAQAPAAGAAAAPAQPAAPNSPTAQPYLTGEQLNALGQQLFNFDDSINQIQEGINSLAANTVFEKAQTDQQAKVDSSNAVDSAISRGLFQSSIKDGDLFDIEATARMKKDFLDTQLNIAKMAGQTRIARIGQAKTNTLTAFNQMAVANAQAVPVNPNPAQSAPGSGQSPPAGGQTNPGTPAPAASAAHPATPRLVHTSTGWKGGYKAPHFSAFGSGQPKPVNQ